MGALEWSNGEPAAGNCFVCIVCVAGLRDLIDTLKERWGGGGIRKDLIVRDCCLPKISPAFP